MPYRKHTKYSDMPGEVYILHFSRPYFHAVHYVGFAEYDLDGKSTTTARLSKHDEGTGSKLMKAVVGAGISYQIAAVLQGNNLLERMIHKRKQTREICPICVAEKYSKTATSRITKTLTRLYKKAGLEFIQEQKEQNNEDNLCVPE